MLILTNIFRINGAGVICYDGLLKIIADMAGGNHIIIPCSIHETIVMSEKTWLDEQVLQEMLYSFKSYKACSFLSHTETDDPTEFHLLELLPD